jgi:hypothetical protein
MNQWIRNIGILFSFIFIFHLFSLESNQSASQHPEYTYFHTAKMIIIAETTQIKYFYIFYYRLIITIQWRILLHTDMKLHIPYKAEKLFTVWATVNSSRRSLLHAINYASLCNWYRKRCCAKIMVIQWGNRALYALVTGSITRLLCDGTNLWGGGEVKGKQDDGVRPLRAAPTQMPAGSRKFKSYLLVTEYGLVRCLLRMGNHTITRLH